jgi:hypothetical protein
MGHLVSGGCALSYCLAEVQERRRVLAADREGTRGVVKSMSAAASGLKETIATNDFV